MRISTAVGSVVNVDWLYLLRQGKAFAYFGQVAAGAGVYSHVQLMNPAGSGVTLLVKRVMGAMGVAGNLQVGFYNTALTTDAGAGVNLVNGSAPGVAHARTQQNAAQLGTYFDNRAVAANVTNEVTTDWIGQLAPGTGLIAVPSAVNISLFCGFYGVEY